MTQSVGSMPKTTSYEKQRAQVSFGSVQLCTALKKSRGNDIPFSCHLCCKPWLSRTGDNKHFYLPLAKVRLLRPTQPLTQQQQKPQDYLHLFGMTNGSNSHIPNPLNIPNDFHILLHKSFAYLYVSYTHNLFSTKSLHLM